MSRRINTDKTTPVTVLNKRRISFFDPVLETLQILRLDSHGIVVDEKEVLPWIEQYTNGRFYLSEFSIAFEDPYDTFIFKLTFRR